MSLNSDKIKSMVICSENRLLIVKDLEIKVNNYVIESVEYLCWILSSSVLIIPLSWVYVGFWVQLY